MRFLFRLAILLAVAVGAAYLVTTEPDLRQRLPWEEEAPTSTTAPAGDAAVEGGDPAGGAGPATAALPQAPEGFTTYATNRGGASEWELTRVRAARNDGFDRVVLDAADDAPHWAAELDVLGDGARVRVTTPIPTAQEHPEHMACGDDPDARLQAVERCTWTFDDGSATLEIELDRSAPYRVQVVEESIAIDVWASGEVGDGTGTPQEAVSGFVFAWDGGSRTAMGDYATAEVTDGFEDDVILGRVAMDSPSCTGVAPVARCEDVWVYEDFEDHTATVGYYTFDLATVDGAWWITRITCDDIYRC